jgi:hypothetical protein
LYFGLDDMWTKVYTHRSMRVTLLHHNLLRSQIIGVSPNNNVAYATLPRVNNTENLQVYWNTGISKGQVFTTLGGVGPPVITDQQLEVQVGQSLNLNPSQFPDVQGLIQGWALSILSHLNGWEVIVAVVLGLYIAHKAFDVVDWILRRLGKAAMAHRKTSPQKDPPKPTTPSATS